MSTIPVEVPAIGQPFQGGVYAGLTIHDNQPMHLVLLPEEFTGGWRAAMAWAKKLDAELPTRMDQLAMWNNMRGELAKDWHWSGEEHGSVAGFAWFQSFDFGFQFYGHKFYELRARAVRRYAL